MEEIQMSEIEDAQSTAVPIPTALVKLIEERIKGTGFLIVSSYVAYVLHEVLELDEADDAGLIAEDEERVKERLRALGYLE
jgi:hypothetical protein